MVPDYHNASSRNTHGNGAAFPSTFADEAVIRGKGRFDSTKGKRQSAVRALFESEDDIDLAMNINENPSELRFDAESKVFPRS